MAGIDAPTPLEPGTPNRDPVENFSGMAAFFGATGFGFAFAALLQLLLTRLGKDPLVPPYSLTVMHCLLTVLLLSLGFRLRSQVRTGTRGRVNPFHAVRLLLVAVAAWVYSALFTGFIAGLGLNFLWRSVPAPATMWLPTLTGIVTAIVLACAARITRNLCRVPPPKNGENDDDDNGDGAASYAYS